MLDFSKIDKTWTLFLDRDGVINVDKEGGYILNVREFVFYEGITGAIKILSDIFGLVILVTNQRGIGKSLMTTEDLKDIHDYMLGEVITAGGRIDKIYFAPSPDTNNFHRKPQIGMALQAKEDFPQIDFSKSIIAGNRLSDMQFGRNAGMHTVFIATTDFDVAFPHPMIDARFDSLVAFTHALNALSVSEKKEHV